MSKTNKGKATHQGGLGLGSSEGEWERAYRQNPLATDVRYWSEWVFERATDELQSYYPTFNESKKPIAYMWARTVICSNPSCRAEVPTKTNWWLSKKDNKRLALKPIIDFESRHIHFEVVSVAKEESWPDEGTMQRDNANCPVCGNSMNGSYLRESGKKGSLGERLLAVIEGNVTGNGKSYRISTDEDNEAYSRSEERLTFLRENINFDGLTPLPEEQIVEWSGVFNVPLYGINTWGSLFNFRQAASLVTLVSLVRHANENIKVAQGPEEYGGAITLYLGIIVDRVADKSSLLVTYEPDREKVSHTFTRQALPMIWDCCEASVLADIGWPNATEWVLKVIAHSSSFSNNKIAVLRGSATNIPLENSSIDARITDPPYYDMVPYADLSDFFYVWLRRSIGNIFPEHFRTPATPKRQEVVQNLLRHDGNNPQAKQHFENMLFSAFEEMYRVLKADGSATIVFAHKTTEAWETLIGSLIKAGFCVETSWPIRTEMASRLRAKASAVLASSTFLNCTKRLLGGVGYFQTVRHDMSESIQPQLAEFWASGIRGADFFMSAIGPGLESYSKHDEVRRVSGEVVTVGEFLDEVRKIVMEFALEQVLGAKSLGAVDAATQFGLLALWGYSAELPSDEARKLAQSVGVELSELDGLVKVSGDKAKLLTLKERAKDKYLGFSRHGEAISMIDAMHKAVALLAAGSRQAVSDYLSARDFLNSEAFWQTMQALAEVQDGADDGRALHELLTIRDNLPKPGNTVVQTLLGANA